MVFLVVMYGCESWTIKKAERWRIDAFELWCWRRPLRVLWIARKSNQLILKEISSEYSLEGLMLKLKLQYFSQFFGKDPAAGKDWQQEEKGMAEDEMVGWHHWLYGHEFKQALGDGEGQESLACCMESKRVKHDWVTEQQIHSINSIFVSISISQSNPLSPSLVDIYQFNLYVCVFISALQIGSSIPCFLAYTISLSSLLRLDNPSPFIIIFIMHLFF